MLLHLCSQTERRQVDVLYVRTIRAAVDRVLSECLALELLRGTQSIGSLCLHFQAA